MTVQEQLDYERRVKLRQTIIAVLAGVLLVAAAAVQITGIHTKVDELTLDLITEHKRYPLDLIGAIVNAGGLIALGLTLNHMFDMSRARNPSIQHWIRWLAVVGAVLSAIAAIAYAAVIAHKADEFVSHGTQTYQQANALTSGGFIVALPLIAQFASLLLTGGFIWISLNAMRVGLLTRFMGYLGVFAGVLVLFPIGSPVPVVQGFWLLAMAYLLSGRWPSGVPVAWSDGQSHPWPSSAQMRAEREQQDRMSPRQKERAAARAEAKAEAQAKSQLARPAWLGKAKAKIVDSTASDVVENGSDAPAPTPKATSSPSPSTSATKRKRKRRH